MSLVILDEFLDASQLTPTEFLQEIALHLFDPIQILQIPFKSNRFHYNHIDSVKQSCRFHTKCCCFN